MLVVYDQRVSPPRQMSDVRRYSSLPELLLFIGCLCVRAVYTSLIHEPCVKTLDIFQLLDTTSHEAC